MTWPELVQVAGLSLAITLAIGGAAVLLVMALRRSSLIVQGCVLVFASLLSVVLSMVGASWLMYISPHDLTVAVNVAVISGVVSLALVAALGAVVVRNARALSRAARRIGLGERVDAVDPQASAEFSALAKELVATSTKLAESREREQRAEQSRRELVAWIAHDLRTPLTGIMSMAEALEDDLAADPQRYHRQMREQVTRLSAMIDDLFELSKIDSGNAQAGVAGGVAVRHHLRHGGRSEGRLCRAGDLHRIATRQRRHGPGRPARALPRHLQPPPERDPAHPGRRAHHRDGVGHRRAPIRRGDR